VTIWQFDDNQSNSKLALHFKKQPSLLFRRIQRIFAPPLKQSEMMDKMMITGLLLCGILIMAVAKNSETVTPIVNKILNPVVQNELLSVENLKTADTLPPKRIREERIIITSGKGKGTDTLLMTMERNITSTDTVFMPQTGKVRIIQSVESESSNNNNEKDDPNKIIIGSINEFRRNSEGWFTITKYRSKDGDTRIDTIHWNDKKEGVRVDKGKWDAKSIIVTENDPLLKDLETELKKDALILNTRKYEFILNDTALNVNGNVMDKKTYDKYKEHYKALTNKQFNNGKFALVISKMDTSLKGEPLAVSGAPTPKMLPGHCYAMCQLDNGSFSEWREIVCGDKITPDLFKSVIAKLKADGSLAASASATEFTKETRISLTAYQKKHKLPVGNLNLETMQHMGIPVK
jgi:hypothetical protein